MATIKPKRFKGTRDFTPREMISREKIINRIKEVFRLHGFSPLETPALEMLEVLSGKYGDEGDKLIYRLDYKNDRPKDRVALRYDLTVPLARVVANHPEWPVPFKRYQVQPVWRADSPQIRQGRFREFYQCDVDTIGAEEGVPDAEIIALTVKMLGELGFAEEGRKAVVHLNHRKILEALCTFTGRPDSELHLFCRALDKLDKIGKDGVYKELGEIGVDDNGFSKLEKVFAIEGDNLYKLEELEALLSGQPAAKEGITGLRLIINYLEEMEIDPTSVVFDPHLARGLDYYTGAVFETVLPDYPHIGSLTGGGRYDKLIGLYSGRDLPAIGTTIGLDRIFAAMEQLEMINTERSSVSDLLLVAYSQDEMKYALKAVHYLRDKGINSEVYPTIGKLKKPFSYADKMGIPFVGVIGPDEAADPDNLKMSLKNLRESRQDIVNLDDACAQIQG